VNVHLILEQRKNSIVVPAAAVQHSTDNDYVWLVKADTNTTGANSGTPDPSASDRPRSGGVSAAAPGGNQKPGSGTVVMQPIVIDTTQGSMVILKSGLEANQQVVIDGADKLQDGAKVSTTVAAPHRLQKQPQQLGPS